MLRDSDELMAEVRAKIIREVLPRKGEVTHFDLVTSTSQDVVMAALLDEHC